MSSILFKAVTFGTVFATSLAGVIASNLEAKAHHEFSKAIAINQTKTIVQTAIDTPSLSSLVSAVKSANLVDTLNSKGPYTVFAPDNNAFSKLKVKVTSTQLPKVLTYHVVKGRVNSRMLFNGQVLSTVNGQKLKVIKRYGKIQLRSSTGNIVTVKTANIRASNGIVHVVNNVLVPRL